MRIRTTLLFAAINALALAGGFLFLKQPAGVREKDAAELSPFKKGQPLPHKPAAANPMVIYKTNWFNWAQVESPDYRQYIANLRAVGCPETTIKDLIMTDVLRVYAAQRGQFYHNGRAFKFWETDEKRKLKPGQLEEREKQLAAIDKELPAVLRELLGINYERELNKYFVDTNEDGRRLAFLSEEKRDQALALRDQFEGKRERFLASAENGQLSSAQLDALRKLDAERKAAFGKILTTEEYENYELCTSETADRLRKELVGFSPTEKEFREIFLRQQALDAKYAGQDMSDETVLQAKAADQRKLEEELSPLLGETRTADLERSKNEDYRSFCAFAEQYDLTPATSEDLLGMRQIAESQRDKLLANKNVAPDRRLEALQAIQAETEQAFRQTMGEKTFAAYSQKVGQWIQNLGHE